MIAVLSLAPTPAVATVRRESLSVPASASATVRQQRALLMYVPVTCSHREAADYFTVATAHHANVSHEIEFDKCLSNDANKYQGLV